jgi:hypothetical protein
MSDFMASNIWMTGESLIEKKWVTEGNHEKLQLKDRCSGQDLNQVPPR